MARNLAILFLFLEIVGIVFCLNDKRMRVREDDLREYEAAMNYLNVDFCLKSINKAIIEYEMHHTNYAHTDPYERLVQLYDNAKKLESVDFSALLTTFAGHVIFCNRDMAEEISRISREVAGRS